MSLFGNELRQVFRRLSGAPLFTVVTVLTLGAGVGANVAVFSVVEGVLLKPLPYPHPGSLVGVWHSAPGLNIDDLNISPSNYFIYREQGRSFEDIGMYQGDSVSVTGRGNPEQVPALDVTDGVLPVLGVAPMLGRWFNRVDDQPGSAETAILSYAYWGSRFGSDQSVVGQSIKVDGKPRLIIGVMPKEFRFLDWEQPNLFLPYHLDRNKTTLGQFSYTGIGRLRPGVSIDGANADIARLLPVVFSSFPAPPGFSMDLFHQAGITPKIRPLAQDVVGDIGKLLWVLMGSIGVVMLIACANVANLMLVRAEGRRQELAVRAALGASPWRIAKQFLVESAVIGVFGGLAGLVLAWAAVRVLVQLGPTGLPRLHDIGIDWKVLVFTLAISQLCALLFGSIPALRYGGARPGTGMREGGRTLSQGRERHRTRNTLVVIQVSLAFVLLICSGLMIRTFRALIGVDPGYDAKAKIQTLHIAIPDADIPKADDVLRTQETIMRKMESIPGVSAVTFGASVPLDGFQWGDPVFAQDRTYANGAMPPLRQFKFISPGYLGTIGISLKTGREFTWDEVHQRLPVAIISENFARDYWGAASNAIGKKIRVSTKDDWRQIVGVVGDVHEDGMNKDAPTLVYWPTIMNHFESDDINIRRYVTFAIRSTRAGSESLMKDVRQAVWSVDANLPLSDVRTQEYYYEKAIARTSFTLVMLGIAATLALLLGVIGLYGVIAYSASQRTREIGIRLALGAQRNTITGMFVKQGLTLAALGVACGLLLAFAATRSLQSQLFHVSSTDPATYLLACLALCGAAGMASYGSSRRIARVNPAEALRSE
ncbi:MAG TPA: ABC transporter permease [Terracidiphilus sp.]